MRHRFAHWFIESFSNWLMKEPPLIPTYLCDLEKIRYEIRPGDVLLLEGRNRISSVIRQITQSNWSHAMLYIGRLHDIEDEGLRIRIKKFYQGSPDEQLLIESLPGQGTIATPLSRYRGYHIRVCRPAGLSGVDAQKVAGYAISHLGMTYSVRHILDLARFLFPWGIMPRRWRSSLFVHNALKPTEEICSSLIAKAFQSVKFPILPERIKDKSGSYTLVSRDARLFTPKDFDFSPFFTIIKHPILAPSEENSYQHLVWENKKAAQEQDA
jgi:hypothetical protein